MILADFMGYNGWGMDDTSIERLQAVVSRYCKSLTGGSGCDAEDLAQDTWVKAIGSLKGLGHTNPEAFLLRVAKNTWIDHSRRKAVLTRILKQEKAQEKERATPPEHGSFEIETAFQALLKHLSPLQRTVFLLKDVFGLSIRETAERLGTTEGAVKAALHRARHSLQAVRADLTNGTLGLPRDEGVRAFLRAAVMAYRMGDLAALVELSQQGELEPAVVSGIIQNRLYKKALTLRSTSTTPKARMAA